MCMGLDVMMVMPTGAALAVATTVALAVVGELDAVPDPLLQGGRGGGEAKRRQGERVIDT